MGCRVYCSSGYGFPVCLSPRWLPLIKHRNQKGPRQDPRPGVGAGRWRQRGRTGWRREKEKEKEGGEQGGLGGGGGGGGRAGPPTERSCKRERGIRRREEGEETQERYLKPRTAGKRIPSNGLLSWPASLLLWERHGASLSESTGHISS